MQQAWVGVSVSCTGLDPFLRSEAVGGCRTLPAVETRQLRRASAWGGAQGETSSYEGLQTDARTKQIADSSSPMNSAVSSSAERWESLDGRVSFTWTARLYICGRWPTWRRTLSKQTRALLMHTRAFSVDPNVVLGVVQWKRTYEGGEQGWSWGSHVGLLLVPRRILDPEAQVFCSKLRFLPRHFFFGLPMHEAEEDHSRFTRVGGGRDHLRRTASKPCWTSQVLVWARPGTMSVDWLTRVTCWGSWGHKSCLG